MRCGVMDRLYYIRRLLSLFRLVLGGKGGGRRWGCFLCDCIFCYVVPARLMVCVTAAYFYITLVSSWKQTNRQAKIGQAGSKQAYSYTFLGTNPGRMRRRRKRFLHRSDHNSKIQACIAFMDGASSLSITGGTDRRFYGLLLQLTYASRHRYFKYIGLVDPSVGFIKDRGKGKQTAKALLV